MALVEAQNVQVNLTADTTIAVLQEALMAVDMELVTLIIIIKEEEVQLLILEAVVELEVTFKEMKVAEAQVALV